MLEVSYLGLQYSVYCFTGTVLESNKQMETRVTGSGGGGATYKGTGATAPVSISSTTIVHDHFFLVDETGKEIAVQLQNWDLALRTGHVLQLIWVIAGKASHGPYVVVENKNLQEVNFNDAQLAREVGKCLAKHFWAGLALSILLAYLCSSWLLLVVGCIATFIYFYVRRGIFVQDLKQKIQQHFL